MADDSYCYLPIAIFEHISTNWSYPLDDVGLAD